MFFRLCWRAPRTVIWSIAMRRLNLKEQTLILSVRALRHKQEGESNLECGDQPQKAQKSQKNTKGPLYLFAFCAFCG
jgi:hypothetical protein